MVPRKIQKLILNKLKTFPAVALLGARQSGKTTLAETFSSIYYDLELEEERLRLDLQWDSLRDAKEPIILDEAQSFPALFPRIRSAIDKDRKRNGRFIILGSVSPGLMKEVSEFLTGRIALCELAPFSLTELEAKKPDALWLMGGYPDGGVLNHKSFPMWQQNYLDLLAMRDLPVWGLPAAAQVTKRLFKMLAASHGTVWNASQIGKSLGVSYHTVNTYVDHLEQAFLLRRVHPYYANIRKRLIKSPKIYWRDSGLLHSLLAVHNLENLIAHPHVGVSWEGWVIEQILMFLSNQGIACDGPFYMRTSDGHELDLILNLSGKIWGVEIKLTAAPSPEDFKKLEKTCTLIKADTMVLISRTERPAISAGAISVNLKTFLAYLAERQGMGVDKKTGQMRKGNAKKK